MSNEYVHGYNLKESTRLQDQAVTLAELFHHDTCYPAGSKVLEAGCGVGAQTVAIAENSPEALITSIDISAESVSDAKQKVESAGLTNVTVQQADIFDLPFEEESFDHVFLCFVLEHLPNPDEALTILKSYIKPGGTITLIEGDHGSTYFHPDNEFSHRAITSLVELQKQAGGDANIGRKLYPLLNQAEFSRVRVSPRMVYVDSSRPEFVEGFTKKTFAAMIEGIRDASINAGLISKEDMDKGIQGLYRAAESDGVFCYTFFKAVAVKECEFQKGGKKS